MCGIAGFVDFKQSSGIEQVSLMSACLRHRGPNDEGQEVFLSSTASVGFGFRRLSILDLSSSGHQPMYSSDKNHVIIFNGEIYNFREIKDELLKLGYSFHSGTDTEVVLNSFKEWGEKCVDRFIGMFAFAIYDMKWSRIYLFRDRVGVKPLFYYWKEGLLLFSSELKSFHQHKNFIKELNIEAMSLYFQDGFISAPHTIFKNTFKLLPGSMLKLDLNDQSFEIKKYWDLADYFNQEKLQINMKDAADQLDALLNSAFQYRMIADVPVGIFLSGGYDSSAVAAILQKSMSGRLKTFTIGFQNADYNEAIHAKNVAEYLDTEHTEYYCTDKDAMDIIPLLPEIYDEPFADSSAIPTYLVSKIARESVTVALSADGGDEMFAGYTKYNKFINYHNKKKSIPLFIRKNTNSVMNLLAKSNENDLSKPAKLEKLKNFLIDSGDVTSYNIFTPEMTESEINYLLNFTVKIPDTLFNQDGLLNEGNDILSKMLYTDFNTFLVDDVLQKVDRATMAVSLEGREPLLDHRIAEFAARLPSQFKLAGGKSKIILRDVVHRYIPKELVDRPKMGFQIPIHNWFRNELKDLLLEFLNEERLKAQGIFNVVAVNTMLNNYFMNKPVIFHRIWKILVFQQWYYRWFKN